MRTRTDNGLARLLFYGELLLCLGCLVSISAHPPRNAADYGALPPSLENPTSTQPSPRPVRRLRSSMSMPYFSFAQVLHRQG